jgi:hypothetical protein
MMTMIILLMGWDYVSELLPITGLSFIPQVIYEYGEPWWNDDVNRRKLLTHLATLPAETSGSKQDEWAKGMKSISVHTYKWFFTCHKILQHGASSFTSPLKEGVLWTFLVLKNPSSRPGLNLWIMVPMARTLTFTPLRWPFMGPTEQSWQVQVACYCFRSVPSYR